MGENSMKQVYVVNQTISLRVQFECKEKKSWLSDLSRISKMAGRKVIFLTDGRKTRDTSF